MGGHQQGVPRRDRGLPSVGRGIAQDEKQADTLRGFVDGTHCRVGLRWHQPRAGRPSGVAGRAGAWPGANNGADPLGQAARRRAAGAGRRERPVPVPAQKHRRADRRTRPQRDGGAAAKRLHRHRAWLRAGDPRRTQNHRRSADVHRPVARPGHGGVPAAHRRERRQNHFVHPQQRLPRAGGRRRARRVWPTGPARSRCCRSSRITNWR